MATYTRIYGSTADATALSSASATYSTARSSTTASTTTATTYAVGQRWSGSLYTIAQYFPIFDTSAIPAGVGDAILSLNVTAVVAGNTDTLEVRAVTSTANRIAGGSLAAQVPLFGSAPHASATGRLDIALDVSGMALTATCNMLVHSRNERLSVAPTVDDRTTVSTADATGTTDDPYLDVDLDSKAWQFVGVSAPVVGSTANITLTEPAGVVAGDLLVACFASRTATAGANPISQPGGWTAVNYQATNNVLTTGSAIASGAMFYCVRGATAPSFNFSQSGSWSVGIGQVVAYRGNAQTAPLDANTAVTAAAGTAVSVAGLTTTQAKDLIVAMTAGGQEAAWSSFNNVTTPIGASGATDTTTAPSSNAWIERADSLTTTGADTSLAIFDAVRTTTGATGNLTATASVSAGHVVIAGAFKIAPPSTADAWNVNDKTASITLSNSDKTATSGAVTQGVRSTTKITNGTAGKYYAEFKLDSSSLIANVGIIDAANSLTLTTGSFSMTPSGTILGTAIDLGTPAQNDIVCLAWDAGAELIWFRLNGGPWNASGTADPATGAEGVNASAAAATPHALWARATGSAQAVTIRTELAEYTQAVPSGFTSWMGESAGGGTGVTVTVDGQATTAAVGDVTISIPAPVSITVDAAGQAVTAAVGDPSVTGKGRVIPTGQAVTSAVGPLANIVTQAKFTVATDAMLANTQGVGVEAGGSISTTAPGQAVTSDVGQVSVRADHKFSVTGQQVASSVGEVSVTAKANVNTIPAGQAVTAEVGQVIVDAMAGVSTTVTGQQVTAAAGEVSVSTVFRIDASVTPAGQEITAAVGTPTITGKANVITIPTGQAVTAGVGTPTFTGSIGVSVLVAGQELVSAVGVPSITTHARFTVTGQEVTSAVGQVGVTSGTGVTVVIGGSASPTLPAYRAHTLSSYDVRPSGLNFDKPAGTVENDVMLATVVCITSGAALNDMVAPAGWTKIGTSTVVTANSLSAKLEVWWKRAGSSEPATYFFDVYGGSQNQYGIISYSGCPTSGDPIDAFSQNSANTGSTATGTGVTTTQAQDNLVWIGHNWDGTGTLTPPSGMTERADSLLYISEQAITAAGATGNRTQTLASSNPWAVYLLSLKGASGAAAFPGLSASVSPPAAVTGTGNVLLAGQEVIASGRGVNVTAGGSVSTTLSSGLATAAAGQVSVKAVHKFNVTGTQADTAVGQVTVNAKQTVSTTVVGQSLAVALSPVTVTAGTRVSVPLVGQTVTSAVGTVNFSLAISALVPLVGSEISAGVGAIYFPIGLDDSVTLDGQSVQAEVGAVTVTTVALRGMDVWTGTSWTGRPAKVWTGSAWVPQPVKVWNGSAWV